MPTNHKTTRSSSLPVDNPIAGSLAGDSVDEKPEQDATSSNTQKAFHRLFLYLQTLNVPEEKARELVRATLKNAGGSSIPEAMRALCKLLTQHLPRLKNEPFSQGSENSERRNSMPSLNRGFMAPNKIDLIPWRTFFLRSLKKALAVIPRPLYFLILFISLIILLFVVLSLGK
jgi:hypothetical protein